MLEFLKKLLSNRTEEIEPGEAPELYRREKSGEIEKAEKKAERLMDESEKIVEEIDQSLEELKDYEDEKGIKAVEDVAENFYHSRKKMIEKLELPENIEEHESELDEFAEEFNDVSVKEGKVLKHIDKGEGELPQTIQQLTDHIEKLQAFLREEYDAVRAHEEIREKAEELQEKKVQYRQLEEQTGEDSVEELENELKDKKQEIEELRESDDWTRKKEMEKEIEELNDDREDIQNWMSRQVSKVDRSLKKILYEVENGDIEFEADLEKLKKLENQDFSELEGVEEELSEAQDILEENDIVEPSQEEKFDKVARELSGLEERKNEIRQIDQSINEIENKLQELDVDERESELVKEKERLEQDIEEERENQSDLEEELEELRDEIRQLEGRLKNRLEKGLGITVELTGRYREDRD